MSVKIKEYHRTFLHYPSRSGPSVGELMQNLGRGGAPPVRVTTKPPENIRDRYVGVCTVANTTRYHDALEVNGSQLREITIQQKGDQKFDQWATPWERIWSPLTSNGKKGLLPVVDGNAMVVGYSGPVLSSNMLIGRATGLSLIYTAEETLKYHRLFVGATSLHAVPDLDWYGDGLNYYAVMTDMDGEITSFQFAYPSSNGSAEKTAFPGLGWLKALQGGLKIFMSVRNGSRTIGRNPPSPPPAPQRGLPPGQTGPPPNPGNVKPGTTTVGGTTSIPRVASVKSRAEIERDIELARQKAVAAAPGPQKHGLLESINIARRQLGLPPLSSAKSISELHYRARNARAYKEIDEWLGSHPNASWAEKIEVLDRMYKRWRVSGLPGDG
jgi:hypothetical protein